MTEIDPAIRAAEDVQTLLHIRRVTKLLHDVAIKLMRRADVHDASKLEAPEADAFAAAPKLEDLTYGSPEYQASLDQLNVALAHHYANNRHHPQHFKGGVDDMTLLDIVEMFCDWKASSERQNDGNLRQSVEDAGKKFNMSPQLIRIFENSIDIFEA